MERVALLAASLVISVLICMIVVGQAEPVPGVASDLLSLGFTGGLTALIFYFADRYL